MRMNAPLLLRSGRTAATGLLPKPNTKFPRQPIGLLLRLPPTYRAFHASPKPQVISTLLASTHDILNGMHTLTCLPWSLTLPLSALLIRLTLTLPLTIYTRRAQQQQLDLQPLLQAWAHQFRRENMAKSSHLGPAVVQRDVARDLRVKRRQLFRRWQCSRWRNFLPVAQLPVWLLMVETVRAMCGTHKGLLGTIFSSSSSSSSSSAMDAAPTNLSLATAEPAAMATAMFEPSLAVEGALWFPDLAAADPMLILPFLLSATMFLNVYATGQRGSPVVEPTPFRRRLTRALGLIALAAGPLTLHVPSAILLYWVSSGLLGYGQGVLLDRLMPFRFPPRPCKPVPSGLVDFKG